jgi:hypothetical protein
MIRCSRTRKRLTRDRLSGICGGARHGMAAAAAGFYKP